MLPPIPHPHLVFFFLGLIKSLETEAGERAAVLATRSVPPLGYYEPGLLEHIETVPSTARSLQAAGGPNNVTRITARVCLRVSSSLTESAPQEEEEEECCSETVTETWKL